MNAKQLSLCSSATILLLGLSAGALAETPTKSSASPDRVGSFNFTYLFLRGHGRVMR
jgi:hypothetical protein